ncbi:hypothetical protein R1flu_004125 [Riccia fluitans]|uniref:Phytocyanin domain-containing protein n=1 Tax=Riccia fluitans TaxID=41844 RepID=A0ABD1YPX4_9MARC
MVASNRLVVILLLLVAALINNASAKTYMVGDMAGWSIPERTTFYDDWATRQSFTVGDKLVLVSTGVHNVYEVSSTDAAACDASNPLAIYPSTSPTITLSSEGSHAFICQFPGHCILGMKIIVDVMTSTPTTNDTGPSPPYRSTSNGFPVAPAFSPLDFLHRHLPSPI